MMPHDRPVVPPTISLPEITIKAVVLSIVLAAILAAANAYLGLFAGMTVSASIPAAVASMAILRLFRRSNILENNIVQTAASSGEALAAGVIFTIPALLLVGYWPVFDYWQTAAIAAVGGLLGVLCTIPLRHALIVGARLQFPEGVATAEVLKVGGLPETGNGEPQTNQVAMGTDFRLLLTAAFVGGAVKLGESGFRLWTESWEGAAQIGRSVVYFGMNLSPALLAVGFLIGVNTAGVVFLGGAFAWLVLMPSYGVLAGLPDGMPAMAAAKTVWSAHIRYVGIGAMLTGGLWTLVQLRGPVLESFRNLNVAYRRTGIGAGQAIAASRYERDAPLPWILVPFVLSLIPMAVIYAGVVENMWIALIMTLVMSVAAVLFSTVAAYMAGLVGSSSNPVSGVTIATLMLSALLLVVLMGSGHPSGPAAALVISAVVCCAAAMGGDNLQDLKTGHLVGATPWKQQVMQVIGVATAAVVIVPVLTLLQAKYGIGDVTADHPHPLSAPQATLMANLARSVFGEGLPWPLVGLGVFFGILVILFDHRQKSRGAAFRVPVMAMALGMYLPLKLSAAILVGGIVAALAQRRSFHGDSARSRRGLLFSAGLITGEALMGIVVALPIALGTLWPSMGADPFAVFTEPPFGPWPGVAAVIAVAGMLYRIAANPTRSES
ncbi:MAG: OPT family oligopeptide transporter [Nitrospiraceae bacterium]